MIPVVCVDNDNGILFGGKRQSRDRVLIEDLFKLSEGTKLYASTFSKVLFENTSCILDDNYLSIAEDGAYCFTEKDDLSKYSFDKIVIYYWNRDYPADKHLKVDLNSFKEVSSIDFEGYSHDKITRKVFEKWEIEKQRFYPFAY